MKRVLTVSTLNFSITATEYVTGLGDKASVSFSFPYMGGNLVKAFEVDGWPAVDFSKSSDFIIFQFLKVIKHRDFQIASITRSGISSAMALYLGGEKEVIVLEPSFDPMQTSSKPSLSWCSDE